MISSTRRNIPQQGCAVIGFDFPIGVPEKYARSAGIKDFKTFLLGLGTGVWSDFYEPARTISEITIHRPFYPFKPGGAKHSNLTTGLGVRDIGELLRECETKQETRRAVCCLFWTLGANQVGKGAIMGWRDVLAHALRSSDSVLLWPFDGNLGELMCPGKVVIAETFPAEYYAWFFAGGLKGKGNIAIRRQVSHALTKWADSASVALEPTLSHSIEEGFPEGDDAFDASIGLFGMIEVISGRRGTGESNQNTVRTLEGWILGRPR